jgi:hypothetical protein
LERGRERQQRKINTERKINAEPQRKKEYTKKNGI